MLGVVGVTAIDVRVLAAAVTVRVAVPLIPFSAAVMVVLPAATAVARPAELMVAVAVLELVQVAVEVMLLVVPSL
jgi:hypothetical protein